jgi:hypothetical protein
MFRPRRGLPIVMHARDADADILALNLAGAMARTDTR